MQNGGVIQDQIVELQEAIQAAQAELFRRESELLDLRAEWTALERQYEARVGTRLAELEGVEADIKACQQQLDEVRIWGAGGMQRRYGPQYASVGEQYRQARQEDASGFSFASFVEQLVEQPLSPEDEAQLKTMYRQLCRRFHPDLAQDEAERICRTEMMAKINAAYTAKDLRAIESLAEQPDCDAISEAQVAEQRLASLRDTLERIQQRLGEIAGEIDQLVHSDLLELSIETKLASQQGRDLWAEMEADLKATLVEKKAELASLKEQVRAYGIEPDAV
jgi:chromosome segregation ATPase